MTIIINGKELEYSLEDEQTLGDVIESLSSWLNTMFMFIESLEMNGEPIAIDDASVQNRTIETISKLDINVIDFREYKINKIEITWKYFLLLEEALNDGDKNALEELAVEYGNFRNLLHSLLDLNDSSLSIPSLDAIFLNREIGSFPQEHTQIKKEIAVLVYLLEARLEEILHPNEHAVKVAKALAKLAEKLDTTAVELQTGKDKNAMTTIIELTELLQTFLRCMFWLKNNNSMDILNNLLEELREALQSGDTVLVGDLLEYEIKPILMELPSNLTEEEEI